MTRPTNWHGLSESQLSHLVRSNTHCPLCEKRFTYNRPRNLDHDHVTGLVRGFLCAFCNRTLIEDRDWMRRAVGYLDSPPAVQTIGFRYVPNSPGAAGFHHLGVRDD